MQLQIPMFAPKVLVTSSMVYAELAGVKKHIFQWIEELIRGLSMPQLSQHAKVLACLCKDAFLQDESNYVRCMRYVQNWHTSAIVGVHVPQLILLIHTDLHV